MKTVIRRSVRSLRRRGSEAWRIRNTKTIDYSPKTVGHHRKEGSDTGEQEHRRHSQLNDVCDAGNVGNGLHFDDLSGVPLVIHHLV
jgi:hypothetical protein